MKCDRCKAVGESRDGTGPHETVEDCLRSWRGAAIDMLTAVNVGMVQAEKCRARKHDGRPSTESGAYCLKCLVHVLAGARVTHSIGVGLIRERQEGEPPPPPPQLPANVRRLLPGARLGSPPAPPKEGGQDGA